MANKLIKKVLENKTSGQRYVVIDRSSEIEPGDYVNIKKVEE